MSTLSLADSTSLLLCGGRPALSSSKLRPVFTDRLFVYPMNLSEPSSDLLGYTQVCSFKFDELEDLKQTRLNRGSLVCRSASSSETSSLANGELGGDEGGVVERLVPSFVVRLWSRASGRYLCVLPIGANVYARGVFGPMGHFRMLVYAEDVVQFRSTLHPEHHLAIRGNTIAGDGRGGADCDLIIRQDEDGYCTLEAEAWPGHYLGVRENGNIMPPATVSPDSHSAHFIVQKEAMDVL